jgi:hypothetical protein
MTLWSLGATFFGDPGYVTGEVLAGLGVREGEPNMRMAVWELNYEHYKRNGLLRGLRMPPGESDEEMGGGEAEALVA